MSDAWDEIQAFKSKQIDYRERLQKRKKERQEFLVAAANAGGPEVIASTSKTATVPEIKEETFACGEDESNTEIEHLLLQVLCDTTLILPITGTQLLDRVNYMRLKPTTIKVLTYFLQKLAAKSYITLNEENGTIKGVADVVTIDHLRVQSLYEENDYNNKSSPGDSLKRKSEIDIDESSNGSKISKFVGANAKKTPVTKDLETTDIMSLLSMPSTREKQSKQVGEEILDLLSKPTAKEKSLVEKFKSQGGAQVMEFCPHGTRAECSRHSIDELQAGKSDDIDLRGKGIKCNKLHFKKIIQQHTDESLGDCSFLNTCFHMDTCKYVHYEVDSQLTSKSGEIDRSTRTTVLSKIKSIDSETVLHPAQWIQCDLRFLDMTILGKFAVIMADPPWDIHMELPYGTMSDDEMRQLGVPALQDDGLIFLWVTGRAMELGRECLKLWGYERSDELIWVKTNQLQRIIRTGRTGHWLNHGKEHCLVGTKGNPINLNRGLDCDVIVAEVRATSHKPDEIYGIIERLSPGTRKIELFGRPHNVQPNWITLGNQLDGIRLVDPELITQFKKRYPDGNCMAPSQTPKANIVK